MVEPISVAALCTLLGGVLTGATDAAGAAIVSSLSKLLRRAVRRDEDEIKQLLASSEPADLEVLAGYLVNAARDDADFAREVQAWMTNAETFMHDSSTTTNSISGTVTGSVLQGRDFNGPIHLA